MVVSYLQSQTNEAARMNRGARRSKSGDKLLGLELYFLYIIIKLMINIYKYLLLGKRCQQAGNR